MSESGSLTMQWDMWGGAHWGSKEASNSKYSSRGRRNLASNPIRKQDAKER